MNIAKIRVGITKITTAIIKAIYSLEYAIFYAKYYLRYNLSYKFSYKHTYTYNPFRGLYYIALQKLLYRVSKLSLVYLRIKGKNKPNYSIFTWIIVILQRIALPKIENKIAKDKQDEAKDDKDRLDLDIAIPPKAELPKLYLRNKAIKDKLKAKDSYGEYTSAAFFHDLDYIMQVVTVKDNQQDLQLNLKQLKREGQITVLDSERKT